MVSLSDIAFLLSFLSEGLRSKLSPNVATFNVAKTLLNKIFVLAGYFMHCRMCLLGNFNILGYEGDKMQNKKIPLLCPKVRLVFLPSIVLSSNQPPLNPHSSHTVHTQQIATHLSLQAAETRLCFP